MARFVGSFKLDRSEPQSPEQVQTSEHIKRVFGWKPESIRRISPVSKPKDAWIVKWRGALGHSFEFICAGGVLVGIPPKWK